VTLLLQTLNEEKATDARLSLLAEEEIAAEALGK
jgi:ferritin-like metal-binding protein YciE